MTLKLLSKISYDSARISHLIFCLVCSVVAMFLFLFALKTGGVLVVVLSVMGFVLSLMFVLSTLEPLRETSDRYADMNETNLKDSVVLMGLCLLLLGLSPILGLVSFAFGVVLLPTFTNYLIEYLKGFLA